jgi:hypothetical protein
VGFLRAVIAVTRLWPGASLFMAAKVVAVVEGVCGAVVFVVSFKAFARPILVAVSVVDALPAVLGACAETPVMVVALVAACSEVQFDGTVVSCPSFIANTVAFLRVVCVRYALDTVRGLGANTYTITEGVASTGVEVGSAVVTCPVRLTDTSSIEIYERSLLTVNTVPGSSARTPITDGVALTLIYIAITGPSRPLIVTVADSVLILSRMIATVLTVLDFRTFTAVTDRITIPEENSATVPTPAIVAFTIVS